MAATAAVLTIPGSRWARPIAAEMAAIGLCPPYLLALTGIDPGAIRAAASEPNFLAGVLEYVSGDERLLIAFAGHAGVAPEEIERARHALGGGNWQRDVP